MNSEDRVPSKIYETPEFGQSGGRNAGFTAFSLPQAMTRRSPQAAQADITFGESPQTGERNKGGVDSRLSSQAKLQTILPEIGNMRAMDEEKATSRQQTPMPSQSIKDKSSHLYRKCEPGCNHHSPVNHKIIAEGEEGASQELQDDCCHFYSVEKRIRISKERKSQKIKTKTGKIRKPWGSLNKASAARKCCRKCTRCREKFNDKEWVKICIHPGKPGCLAARHVECPPPNSRKSRTLRTATPKATGSRFEEDNGLTHEDVEPVEEEDDDEDYIDLEQVCTPKDIRIA